MKNIWIFVRKIVILPAKEKMIFMKKYTFIFLLLSFSLYVYGQEVNLRVGKDSLKTDTQLEQTYS